MGKWSNWYPFTKDGIEMYASESSGVYKIRMKDHIHKYLYGKSDIIYIGTSPDRTVEQRLKEHLRGEGNLCVYEHLRYDLEFCDMVPDFPRDTEWNALDKFEKDYGELPDCNKQKG